MVGTIRHNKGELPHNFVNAKNREPYSTVFGFQKDIMILSYCPKKNKVVTLPCILRGMWTIAIRRKRLRSFYHTTLPRQVLTPARNYCVKRMTRRWPVVVFYNMVDISALNAYIVWSSLHPTDFARKAHKRRQFLLALGKELGGIEKDVPTESILIDTEEPPRKKRRCYMCSSKREIERLRPCARNVRKTFVVNIPKCIVFGAFDT